MFSFARLTLIVLFIVFITAGYVFFLSGFSGYSSNSFIKINRTIAISGVLCIMTSLLLSTLRKTGLNLKQSINYYIKHLGLIGFYLASVHIFMSLMLLNQNNHPYLYDVDLQLNLSGQMVVLFGAISFGIFLLPAITSIPVVKDGMSKEKWKSIQRLSYFGISIVMIHLLFLTYEKYYFAIDNGFVFSYESFTITILILILLIIRMIFVFNKKKEKM